MRKGYNPFDDSELVSLNNFPDQSSTRSMSLQIEATVKLERDQVNKYLQIYILLGEAVETLVDTIETFKDDTVSLELLENVSDCMEMKSNSYKDDGKNRYRINTEDDEYYQFLMEKNFNENTEKYIIRGQRDDIIENVEVVEEIGSAKKSLPSIFKSRESFSIEPEKNSFHSIAIQTSDTEAECQPIYNDFLMQELNKSEHEIIPEDSLDRPNEKVFYYIDDKL